MSSHPRTARWWAFVPYVLVAVIHLAALFTDTGAVSGPTKSLLMPALMLGMLVAMPTVRSRIALWAGLAILLSWVGDLLLAAPGNSGFVAGLGAFMLAHVAYLVLFLGPLHRRRIPRATLVLVLWWGALLVVLAPYLGTLLLPVALYGLVLGSSTAASFGTTRLIAMGSVLFLASDTLLAFKLFWPDFSVWQKDVLVMLGYTIGQGVIIVGTVMLARRRIPAAVSRSVP